MLSTGLAVSVEISDQAHRSLAWVVGPFRVPLELRWVVVHLAKIAGGVPLRLIVEVLRLHVAALAARRHRARVHAVLPELNDRHEAVPAGAVPLLRVRVGARAERRE